MGRDKKLPFQHFPGEWDATFVISVNHSDSASLPTPPLIVIIRISRKELRKISEVLFIF